MNKTRRHFTGEQKAQIVRRHLGGKEPVSKLADEFEVQPSQIPLWVKLVQKNEVISELMEDNVRAKKANGELGKDAGFVGGSTATDCRLRGP